MKRSRFSRFSMLLVAAFTALSLVVPVANAQTIQAGVGTTPSLVSAAPIPQAIGAVSIAGTGFTPGGAVFVALHNSWGVERHEPRWLVASTSTYGPNGSQDPALGYRPGGTIGAVFGMSYVIHGPDGSQDPARGYVTVGATGEVVGSLCGDPLMARAYDAGTGEWSNVLDIDPGC